MKRIELAGRTFGRLRVIGPTVKSRWACQCSCGKSIQALGSDLRRGQVKSCGCLRRETARATGKAGTRHGQSYTKVYQAWRSMKKRCYSRRDKDYIHYGARGIKVCDRWLESFDNFYADMGDAPKAGRLGRIENNKGYAPGNCQWESHLQQNRNRRFNRIIRGFGVDKALSVWIQDPRCRVSESTLSGRLARGWTLERALTTAPDQTHWSKKHTRRSRR